MESNIVGAKWFKCDLHLHTPESKCFIDKCSPVEYMQTVVEKGLEVIAITDHNSAGWIDSLKPLAIEKNIALFPGVEITCGDNKIHLLILFDRDKTQNDVQDFLIQLGIKRENFGEKTVFVNQTIIEICEKAEKENLLVIPSHIDDYNGICCLENEEVRKAFLNREKITGVQIVNSISNSSESIKKDDYSNEELNSQKIENTINQVTLNQLSKLTFSDNPHNIDKSKHGISGIGEVYSWIKMKRNPDLESLKQALIMGKDRVKNIFDSPAYPYNTPNI
jgi:PHP family Zn ribbon phosphoesterase